MFFVICHSFLLNNNIWQLLWRWNFHLRIVFEDIIFEPKSPKFSKKRYIWEIKCCEQPLSASSITIIIVSSRENVHWIISANFYTHTEWYHKKCVWLMLRWFENQMSEKCQHTWYAKNQYIEFKYKKRFLFTVLYDDNNHGCVSIKFNVALSWWFLFNMQLMRSRHCSESVTVNFKGACRIRSTVAVGSLLT